MLVALLIFLLPGVVGHEALDEAKAAAELAQVQESFRLRPGGSWRPDAEALIARWPQTEVAGRACLWLGAIALEQGRTTAARGWFDEALRRRPHGEIAVLARRGAGDTDFREGHYGAALAAYREARPGASGALAFELDEKMRQARRERALLAWEVVAWALIAGAAIAFAVRLRGKKLRVPAEAWFLLPVYALLVGSSWKRDPILPHALLAIALGSLALVVLAGGGERRRGKAGLMDAALLAAANLALVFVALQRTRMVGLLWGTLKQTQ